jgi:hypothetical protein
MTIRRPSLGTVLGATALLVAIAGTGAPAEAAKLINGKLIKAGTITSKQIKNGTITNADLAPGTLKAGKVGPAGPKGATGAAGSPGVADYQIVNASQNNVATGGTATVLAWCPQGKRAVGGGGTWSGGPGNEAGWLSSNYPLRALRDEAGNVTGNGFPNADLADGWVAAGTNKASGTRSLEAWVICAKVA